MYLHCLKPKLCLPEKVNGIEKLMGFYSQPLDTGLRSAAFSEILTASKLYAFPPAKYKQEFLSCSLPGDIHSVTTSPGIVEKTMWFPYHTHSTIMCESQGSTELTTMLETLYKYFSTVSKPNYIISLYNNINRELQLSNFRQNN